MKALLGCLMCLVLTLSQAFAISGGPFGRGGAIVLTGTYAGVLTAIAVVVDPGPPPVTLPPDNSLGLFSLVIPSTGLHLGQTSTNTVTGTVVIFRNGIVYTGYPVSGPTQPSPSPLPVTARPAPGITGVADPDTGKLRAIINAYVTPDPFVFGTSTANGRFDTTRIVSATTQAGLGATRIRGSASITYRSTNSMGDSGGEIAYHVRGFKQSGSL
jgi:hypothetical protein